tara:strand:- start:269 stop:922 length:654 start_codon:yes stop_codon:yes gene_type:complete
MKNVIITGATGMVGSIVLQQCLGSIKIEIVTSISRTPSGIKHSKLVEIIHDDFKDFSSIQSYFENVDIAYFCLGAYTGSVPDAKFKEITVDYTKAFADILKKNSPQAHFCFLSGAGADPKEKSRMSFAKYKGMAENYLISHGFKSLYIFRPSYNYPFEKREEPNFSYRIIRKLYPLLKLFGSKYSIKSTELARAIFKAGFGKNKNIVLENQDILQLI